jgi:GR25 family glycosyltransferase involved in LPS biosynthesis
MKFVFDENNTFCINLARRNDRWEKVSSIFNEIGLKVTRHNASEPKDVVDNISNHLSPTQRACTQSHVNVWKRMFDNNLPYVFVMEDDITFDKNWREKLETFPEESFDLIQLNSIRLKPCSPHQWHHTEGDSYLCGGYIISNKCARSMISKMPIIMSDHMFVRYQQETMNKGCYSYFPYLIIQTSLDSDIVGSIPEHSYGLMATNLNRIGYDIKANYV